MKACPSCNRFIVIPICYGKPVAGLLEAAKEGLCLLRGCLVEDNSPNWHCKSCGLEWLDSVDQNSSAKLNEIHKIVNENLFPIYMGMILTGLTETFYSRDRRCLSDYGRLKKLLNIGQGIDQRTLEDIEGACRHSPDMTKHMMQLVSRRLGVLLLQETDVRSLGTLLIDAAVVLCHAGPFRKGATPEELKNFEQFLSETNFSWE